jgi:hypothetical protein
MTDWLLTEFAGVAVVDSQVVLRCVMSCGRRLGRTAAQPEIVPVNLWAPVN